MKHLQLNSINPGNHYAEKKYVELVKKWDGKTLELSSNKLEIGELSFRIRETEDDFFTITYQGQFSDGTSFRAIIPSKSIVHLSGENITIGSIHHDGFAVNFKIS